MLLLTEFQRVHPQVGPKLLKTVEEPPASTFFVILAEDVPPELVTIASRAVRIDFGPVPEAHLVDALVAEGVEGATAETAARASGGRANRARLLASDPGFAGRLEAAQKAQVRFAPLVRALFCETNPLPVKHALHRMGRIGPELRLPLVPVSEKGAAQVESALKAYGLT